MRIAKQKRIMRSYMKKDKRNKTEDINEELHEKDKRSKTEKIRSYMREKGEKQNRRAK